MKRDDGWVWPEYIAPLPQCVYQVQNATTWFDVMTACSPSHCSRHFGVICESYDPLTQISCLADRMDTAMLGPYYANCDRSIVSKVQLYTWLNVTLVDTWNARPADWGSKPSAVNSYGRQQLLQNVPDCLNNAQLRKYNESFSRAMDVCSFSNSKYEVLLPTTGTSGFYTWAWKGSSMTAGGYEVPGSNALGATSSFSYAPVSNAVSLSGVLYEDKECICDALNTTAEPCATSSNLDRTRERLWLNATCPSNHIADNWTDSLLLYNASFSDLGSFSWPQCISNASRTPDCYGHYAQALSSCSSKRCAIASNGYCNIMDALDKQCFCQSISYAQCNGSCKYFQGRMDYVSWLNSTCASVPNWAGLPTDWLTLSKPIAVDLVPWTWRVKPSTASQQQHCPSNAWKLASLAIVNIVVALLIPFASKRTTIEWLSHGYLGHPRGKAWITSGCLFATLHVISNIINASIVKGTPGYEHVAVGSLALLWCTRPRVAWLTILLLPSQAYQVMYFPSAAASLLSELILQLIASYYIGSTANYGRVHHLYTGAATGSALRGSAQLMYGGALLWLIVVVFAIGAMVYSAIAVDRLMNLIGEELWKVQGANPSRDHTARRMSNKASQAKQQAGSESDDIRSLLADEEYKPREGWQDLSASLDSLAVAWDHFARMVVDIPKDGKSHRVIRKERFGTTRLQSVQNTAKQMEKRLKGQDWLSKSIPRSTKQVKEYRDYLKDVRTYKSHRMPELQEKLRLANREKESVGNDCQIAKSVVIEAADPYHQRLLEDRKNTMVKDWETLLLQWNVVIKYWMREIDNLKKLTQEPAEAGTDDIGHYALDEERPDIEAEVHNMIRTLPIILTSGMILLWIAQWLFWSGAIQLMGDRHVEAPMTISLTSRARTLTFHG